MQSTITYQQQCQRITELQKELDKQKKISTVLFARKDLYKQAQRIAQFGTLLLNIESKTITLNDQAYLIVGLKPQSAPLTIPQYLEIIHPSDRDILQNRIDHLVNSRQGFELELRHLTQDNSINYVHITVAVVADANETTKIIGTVSDITKRKNSEIQLSESEEQLSSALAGASLGYWDWDFASGDYNVNDRWLEMLGIERDDITNTFSDWEQRIHPEDKLTILAIMESSFDQGDSYTVEFRMKHSHGNWLWIESSGAAISYNTATGQPLRICGTHQDISARKLADKKIEHLAFFDHLTNLPNRRLLQDRLKQTIIGNHRNRKNSALLFIDLDNFKNINDTLGHNNGDILLNKVSQRLLSSVRGCDTVARFGGDEFVVLLTGLSKKTMHSAAQAKLIGEKILHTLAEPYLINACECHSTASIGLTLFNRIDLDQLDELLKQADIAMYQAKKAGRNRLSFFDPTMQEAINNRTHLEADLYNALAKQEFQLHYQVQVDQFRRPLGVEALIRWYHPIQGLIPPMQFIPLAEESGLILPIGHWVLHAACKQLEKWQHDPLTAKLIMALNVSAKQFHQAHFVTDVIEAVKLHNINPSLLKIELTESILLENVEETIANMNELNKLGIQFSLDDFGTGYSSLQYLKRLPLDQLKIDQSFVQDIVLDDNDKVIVQTIIAMASSMNIAVIAEGVETEEQLTHLLNSHCTHYQGYLFSKPIPIELCDAYLLAQA
ncbi:MAG: EAL domain-containing protein [Mariprofundus sp.]|nr:EAL domain-containing protein [Mariprofundus sp.]